MMLEALKRKLWALPGARGGLFDCDCDCANYAPVAQAAQQANVISEALGREQLAEARRQYDQNYAVAKPVSDAQLALMQQAKAQGDDYYNYMVAKQRPVENALNAEAMGYNPTQDANERAGISGRIDSLVNQNRSDIAAITGGDTAVYNARQGDIENMVSRALADSRQGQTAAVNTALRQGLRYGYSPAKLAAMAGNMSSSNALAQANAANQARNTGIEKSRGLMAQGYDMRNANENMGIQGAIQNRNMRIQDNATQWGRKMDVAGLYRNMPGASQGAYSLANGAGSSAVQSQMAPGNALMSGMSAANGTRMQGLGMQVNGLLGAANGQQSAFNNMSQQGGGLGSILGLASAGMNIYTGGVGAGLWGGI